MAAAWTDRLFDFVARWFERPIGHDDGNTDAELARVRAALSVPMPGVLRTW